MKFRDNERNANKPLLIRVLRQPDVADSLDVAAWGLLVRQARTANVVGRTLAVIDACLPSGTWPLRAQQVFLAEKHLADHRFKSLCWEVDGLARMLALEDVRPILLKGAAYLVDGQAFAQYRHFGDIDILVPRSKLGEVERLLNAGGWLSTKSDPYDQQYFRHWMHELPPMQHLHRGTNLDVHHAILPLTARYKPDSRLLLDSTNPARCLQQVDVLSPADMFLHAAAHLFCEGEHENALRNLLDLNDLLSGFFQSDQLTTKALINRSIELDLAVVLGLAARYLDRIFGLEIAVEITQTMQRRGLQLTCPGSGDWIFDAVFLGFHPSYRPPLLSSARLALYLRGHALRMPIGLLAVHLMRKAWSGRRK